MIRIPETGRFARRSQAGFGLLETMTGLIVFVVIAIIGTKAYRGVVANQKESAQVKALTDAVTVIAERLSAHSVAALTEPGSGYLEWSEPAVIGSGEYRFRYRTVPRPNVSGVPDTAVVGLEVEVGSGEGTFVPGRLFATLIAPHLSSKDRLGQVSTAVERGAEAAFYAGHRARVQGVVREATNENQTRLNSYSCYDQGQCCGFMRKFFADPGIKPEDGLDEKCFYRCAMAGNVSVKSWNGACGQDFCAIAPWKTSEQCCAAIEAGQCEPGTVCANVCVGCVGEDGTTCGPPLCDGGWWNDFFDCANENFCDGTDLPEGDVAGWGGVKRMCKNSTCALVTSECQARLPTCCREYWSVVNSGGQVDPRAEVCKTISSHSDCCMMPIEVWDWDAIHCGTDGKVVSAHNKVDNKWYCGGGSLSGEGWDKTCAYAKGCASTYVPSGAGSCVGWTGPPLSTPWVSSYPKPEPPKVVEQVTQGQGIQTTDPPKKTTTDDVTKSREPSNRKGEVRGSRGGRE